MKIMVDVECSGLRRNERYKGCRTEVEFSPVVVHYDPVLDFVSEGVLVRGNTGVFSLQLPGDAFAMFNERGVAARYRLVIEPLPSEGDLGEQRVAVEAVGA